jgi:hypothetical protein
MSIRRGHLWILLATPLLVSGGRVYLHDLARRPRLPVKGSGLAKEIEVFPRHNVIGEGGFANAIHGPPGQNEEEHSGAAIGQMRSMTKNMKRQWRGKGDRGTDR